MFRVVLPPEVIAFAMVTAENRPKFVSNHIPAFSPDADLVGATAEHAWAWKYRIPQDSIVWDGGPDGWGDGGIDFIMDQGTIDIKASNKYPQSWVIKKGPLRADWYVFATVTLPDTVIFKGFARREELEAMPLTDRVGGNRLVQLEQVHDIGEKDFTHP